MDGLHPSKYLDPGWLGKEVDSLFCKEWLCVGRETDLPEPGSYLSSVIAGQPVLIWRGLDGEICAYENVCRHRMSVIASGCGVADMLSCPFHGWTYATDGSLKAAPGARDLVASGGIALPTLSVETWMGFIFVNLDQAAPPLAPRLKSVEALIAPYEIDRFEFSFREESSDAATNWKLMMEIGLESYHFQYVHQETLAEDLTGIPGPAGTGEWTVSVEPRVRPLTAQPSDPAGLNEKQRGTTYTFGIFPAMVFNVDVDNLVWFSVFPKDTALTSSVFGGASRQPENLRRLGADEPSSMEEYLTWAAQLGAEDNLACERVQQGLSGRLATPGPLLRDKENGVIEFHNYLRNRLDTDI